MDKADLAVVPPVWVAGQRDRETFGFDAKEAIVDATAVVLRIPPWQVVGGPTRVGDPASGVVEAVQLGGTVASVTVSGLERGYDYELSVTFEAATGRRWTRVLTLRCVV